MEKLRSLGKVTRPTDLVTKYCQQLGLSSLLHNHDSRRSNFIYSLQPAWAEPHVTAHCTVGTAAGSGSPSC